MDDVPKAQFNIDARPSENLQSNLFKKFERSLFPGITPGTRHSTRAKSAI
jgi:hypothetical protein